MRSFSTLQIPIYLPVVLGDSRFPLHLFTEKIPYRYTNSQGEFEIERIFEGEKVKRTEWMSFRHT